MSANRTFVFDTVSSLLGLVGLLTAITPASRALADVPDDTHWGTNGSAVHTMADDTHWAVTTSPEDTHW